MNTEFLKQVKEFHNTFGHPVLNEPTIPSEARMDLRYHLIKEENEELLKDGIEKKNIIEVADALADLMYVLCGAILEFGMQDKFLDIFNEVHRSNMSKACKTMEEVENTIANYAEQGISTYYKKINELELYVIHRTSDDKILKSINYSPANLKQFLK